MKEEKKLLEEKKLAEKKLLEEKKLKSQTKILIGKDIIEQKFLKTVIIQNKIEQPLLDLEEKKEKVRKKVEEALAKRKEEESEYLQLINMSCAELIVFTNEMSDVEIFNLASKIMMCRFEKKYKVELFQSSQILLELASHKGHHGALDILVNTLEISGGQDKITDVLIRHVKIGNFKAILNLAYIYLYGFYDKQHIGKAYEHFLVSQNFIEQIQETKNYKLYPYVGDVLFILGIMEYNFKIIDLEDLFNQCEKAAQFGSKRAQIYTALNNLIGYNIKKNPDMALEWLLKAYNQQPSKETDHFYMLNILNDKYKTINIKLNWNIIKLICLIFTTYKTDKSAQWVKDNIEIIKKAKEDSLTVDLTSDIMLMTQINGFLFYNEKTDKVGHIIDFLKSFDFFDGKEGLVIMQW